MSPLFAALLLAGTCSSLPNRQRYTSFKNFPVVGIKENYEVDTPVEKVEETISLFDYTETVDAQGLEEKIGSMMEPTEKSITVGKGKRTIWVCKVCGKEGQVGNVQHHIESHHITGVTHTCNICGKTSKSRNALGMHKSTYHKKSSKPKEIHLELFTCQADLQGSVE